MSRRRVVTSRARVCRNHPEAFALVASGALHASALSLLRKHLTTENAVELFQLCKQRSARKVEELLATRFPRPDVRDLVRRLPARRAPLSTLGVRRRKVPTENSPREPSVELERQRRPNLGRTSRWRRQRRRNQGDSNHFPRIAMACISPPMASFAKLLERVRGLAGHRLPSGDSTTLLKRGLEAYERELSKQRFALGRKPRHPGAAGQRALPAPLSPRLSPRCSAAPAPRLLSRARASEARTSSQRAEREPELETEASLPSRRCARGVPAGRKQCSYVSPDGRRCNARHCLELDHVAPYAVGGQCTIENLRLRCRAHNQRYARQYFGKSRVEAALRHARLRRAAAERPDKS